MNETENINSGESTEAAEKDSFQTEPKLSAEEALRAEVTDWKEKYLRKMAEFENFRKRSRQESEMLGQLIGESLVVSLLPIMDDFDRVLNNLPPSEDPLRKGIELIRGKLKAFFDSRNVKILEARGKQFNPNEHDAVMMKPTNDFPAGTVLDVAVQGYMMGDKVIRHAQVIVSEEMKNEPEETEKA